MPPILIIEPDIAIGRLFETALRGAGYTVFLAHSAVEGYKILSRLAFAMVITDLNMPSGVGPEIVSVVRHNFPETKIIGISREASEFDPAQAAPVLDSVEVLRNPIGVSHLLGTVERLLNAP